MHRCSAGCESRALEVALCAIDLSFTRSSDRLSWVRVEEALFATAHQAGGEPMASPAAPNPFMPPTAQAAAAAATAAVCGLGLGGCGRHSGAVHMDSAITFDCLRASHQSAGGGVTAPQVSQAASAGHPRVLQAKKVDYMELPQPVRYEELQREVMSECTEHWAQWRRRQERPPLAGCPKAVECRCPHRAPPSRVFPIIFICFLALLRRRSCRLCLLCCSVAEA